MFLFKDGDDDLPVFYLQVKMKILQWYKDFLMMNHLLLPEILLCSRLTEALISLLICLHNISAMCILH